MKSREIINYYKIPHPLKDKSIVICDRDQLNLLLRESVGYEDISSSGEIQKRLYVNKKDAQDTQLVKEFESSTKEEINYRVSVNRGISFIFLAGGIMTTYLIMPYADWLGEVISFPFVSAYGLNPENLPAIFLVLSIPILLGIAGFTRKRKTFKDLEKWGKAIKNLREGEAIEDENLQKFYAQTASLTDEIRGKFALIKSGNRKEKTKLCKQIKDNLKEISVMAKILGLQVISSYYDSLANRFYSLQRSFSQRRIEKWMGKRKKRKSKLGIIAVLILLGGFIFPGIYHLNKNELAIVTRKEFGYGNKLIGNRVEVVNYGEGSNWH